MKHKTRQGPTHEFAEGQLVKPDTVRRRYCLTGSYFGVIPTKLPNGRLAWPLDDSHAESAQEVEA